MTFPTSIKATTRISREHFRVLGNIDELGGVVLGGLLLFGRQLGALAAHLVGVAPVIAHEPSCRGCAG